MKSLNIVFKIIIVLVTVLLINSCQYFESNNYSSKIDELITLVYDFDKQFHESKMDSIIIAYGNVNENIRFYKKNLNVSEYDSAFLKDFSKYSLLNEQLKKLNKELSIAFSEIEYSKKQLENLKKDVKNRAFKKERIEEYYNVEKRALDELNMKVEPLLEKVQKRMKLYNELEKKMDKLREEIEKK